MKNIKAPFLAAFAMGIIGLFAEDAAITTKKNTETVQVSEKFKEEKSLAYGDDDTSSGSNNRMSSGDHLNDTYDKIKGTTITPNAGPVVSGGLDLFVSADFIYWYSTIAPQFLRQNGNVTSMNSINPGFKVAAGADLSFDGWDTMVEYTWLHAKKTLSPTPPSVEYFLTVNKRRLNFLQKSGSETSTWNMHFNNINWELGRSFFLSPNLVSRLHIGLRTSWQSHKIVQKDFAIALAEISAVPEDVIVINSSVSTYNQSYWGMGIRAGLGTSWMFTRNWSLFGNMALSPVWSKFKLKKRWQDDLTIDLTGEYSDIVSRDALFIDPAVVFHKIDMVYEFQLGLRFDYFFNDSDYRLRVEAAWEEQYWAGLGEIVQGINGSLSEPYGLTMQGLTVKVGFDF